MQDADRERSITRPPVKRRQLISELRQQIVDGRYRPAHTLPTQEELARTFRVSKPTVQQAIRRLAQDGFVVTRGRNGTSVAAHPPHLYHYGLVFLQQDTVLDVSQFLFALRREADTLSRQGPRQFKIYYGVEPRADNAEYRRLLADLDANRVAGLVFPWAPLGWKDTTIIQNPAIPRVVFASDPSPYFMCLSMDMQSFADMGLEALRTQGRRRVAALIISEAGEVTATMIHEAAKKRGMTCPPEWIQAVDPNFSHWAASQTRLLVRSPAALRPDGLLITDDNLTEHATAGLLAAGLRVPEEISVVTYCNAPWPTRCLVPARRLGFDVRDILRTSMEMIDRRIAGRNVPAVTPMLASFIEPPAVKSIDPVNVAWSRSRLEVARRLVEAGKPSSSPVPSR